MATIRRKNDKWQVQIRRKGFAPVSRTFNRKTDVQEWARTMELKADRKDMPQDARELDDIALGDLIDRYIQEIVNRKKSREIETIILNAFKRHKICRKALSALTMDDWNKYRDERLETIKPKSLKRVLSPIQNMFTVAMTDWELPIKENPISKLRLKAEDNKRDRRLKPGEQEQILAACKNTRAGYLHDIVLLAIETGMRRGELLRIQRDHLDLERSLLAIPVTKNGEARTIPLTPQAQSILFDRLGKIPASEKRLFKATETALRMSWDRICVKIGIDDLNFHDLRHEAISRFFEMGLTAPEVASISGHKDIRMLFRYAHATRQAVLQKLSRYVVHAK
jgi:integrase